MIVVANGKPREVAGPATVQSFLDSIGYKPEWVVVEHNGEPVDRRRFAEVSLAHGDKIEVVRAVAGG